MATHAEGQAYSQRPEGTAPEDEGKTFVQVQPQPQAPRDAKKGAGNKGSSASWKPPFELSTATALRLSYGAVLIALFFLILALTLNSWSTTRNTTGTSVTDYGLWKRCDSTRGTHGKETQCFEINFYPNCTYVTEPGTPVVPGCSRIRTTGATAILTALLAAATFYFLRQAINGDAAPLRTKILSASSLGVIMGVTAMAVWIAYWEKNHSMFAESRLGTAFILFTISWILLAIITFLCSFFIPGEIFTTDVRKKLGAGLLGLALLAFLIVIATPGILTSEPASSGQPSGSLGLFYICSAPPGEGPECWGINEKCEYTTKTDVGGVEVDVKNSIPGCPRFQASQAIGFSTALASVIGLVLVVLGVRGGDKKKVALGIVFEMIACICAFLTIAILSQWVQEASAYRASEFGYSFIILIVGGVLTFVGAAFLYSAGEAEEGELFSDSTKSLFTKIALGASVIAIIVFAIAVGLPMWTTAKNDISESWVGLYQQRYKDIDGAITWNVINTKCEVRDKDDILLGKLPDCDRFQATRAFSIIAVLFAVAASVVAILSFKGDKTKDNWAFVLLLAAGVSGLVGMGLWSVLFERHDQPTIPDAVLGASYYLEATGWVLEFLAALLWFLSHTGAK